MRPAPCECCFSRLFHVGLIRVFLRIVSNFSLYRSGDRPAAVGRVLQVLEKRIIAGFPPIQASLAKEAHNIVGIIWARVKEKSGSRKLFAYVSTCRVAGESKHVHLQAQCFCAASSMFLRLVRSLLTLASSSSCGKRLGGPHK